MNGNVQNEGANNNFQQQGTTKYCKHCGRQIAAQAVICPLCGCQVEEFRDQTPVNNGQPIVINNTNTANASANVTIKGYGKAKNKWVSLILCLLLGCFGAHKFYEGKIGMGILYLFTCGLFFVGVVIDVIAILAKPTTYYV